MKICIPTADDSVHALAEHFGRAPFLTMLDVESGRAEVVRNPGCHSGSRECNNISILTAHGVDAVVCRRMGRRASSSLETSGIAVLEAPPAVSVQAIGALARAGELHPLTQTECGSGGHHGHGGACRGHHG